MESLLHTIGIEIVLRDTQLFWFSSLAIILDISQNYGIHKREILVHTNAEFSGILFPRILRLYVAAIIIKIIDTNTDLYLEFPNGVMWLILFEPHKTMRVR